MSQTCFSVSNNKCPNRINLRPLTGEMKRAFAGHCDVAYPGRDELITPTFEPPVRPNELAQAQMFVKGQEGLETVVLVVDFILVSLFVILFNLLENYL